ncbi:glycoside hydrolase family 2 TIM barrel-domain containing protein [Sphingobacterium thalpophilum]|uniref:glycoside hydrolase family 2 TIM barrel-domain containing protein n=1 Tax=Sphingobacterium thalpophilum TaxID=259 RepID=UPI0037D9B1FE
MLYLFSIVQYSRIWGTLYIWLAMALTVAGQSRQELNFNRGWWFKLDSSRQYVSEKRGEGWRLLDLPHDWSIEQPFRQHSPAGSGAAYLDGGIGWYQKSFVLPASAVGQRVFIAFEGIYQNSEVWINGHFLGRRPNGYIGFEYELSAYLHKLGRENVLTVKVNNKEQPNSRFYSGSGIYRDVKLVIRNPVSLATGGTFIKTLHLDESRALVNVGLEIENTKGDAPITVLTELISPQGKVVASKQSRLNKLRAGMTRCSQDVSIDRPILWDIESPHQYKAVVQLLANGRVLDRQETKFGLRQFSFDEKQGFVLNGRQRKIRGVCLHSDLGALGMAFNRSAALRQLRLMKQMGANGIRTSHNPAAPALLDLCDSLGFVVMSETFDVWKGQKNPFDYHLYWDQWHQRDFADHVKRDRNHPSLFIWCLGNEAQEQWHARADGKTIPMALSAIVDSLDGTRPTTIANNEMSKDNPVLMSTAVDLVGYNYNHKKWASFPQDHPGKKFIVTESTSALASRGQYDLVPYDSVRMWPERWDIPFDGGNNDKSISAYDHVFTPWGSDHHTSLKLLETYDHIAGMYVWTGFDYLGEPTPYTWPARSSYFGIVDLAGFPKDVYYLYQSVWTKEPVLHLLPHWNWQQGDRVDVVVYFNQADRVELYLNGKKIGDQAKNADRYDLVFKGIAYEAGTLEAVSYRHGQKVRSSSVRTAAEPYQIKLIAESPTLDVDAKELSFIHAYIVDQFGTLVPEASPEIEFGVEGDGSNLVATDNGNTVDHSRFQSRSRRAFHGKALAIVMGGKPGSIVVTAKSPGLHPGRVEVRAR